MDRKLLVLLAVALFGAGFFVCGAEKATPEKSGETVAETKKAADKPVDVAKSTESQTWCSNLKTSLLYVSNRLLDLFDIVTIDLGAGAEFGVEGRVTHWMQVGGMCGDKYFLGKDYARQFGGGYASGWNYEFICLTSERRYVDDNFGTTREFILKRKPFSLAMPKDDFTYTQDIRDFWEVGANAGWLVTVGVAVHPIEIVDFFAGFAMIDLKGDDYTSTTCAEKAKEEKK